MGGIYINMLMMTMMRDEGVHRREREDEMKKGPVSYLNLGVINSFTSATKAAVG